MRETGLRDCSEGSFTQAKGAAVLEDKDSRDMSGSTRLQKFQ